MTMIDGVGDEVVQFVIVVLGVVVAALAWWSTNARPDRYRTVLVMRSRTLHPVTISIRTRSNLMIAAASTSTSSIQTATTTDATSTSTPETTEEPTNARMMPLQEMDSIVDAEMAMLDNNRLHFYRRVDSPNNTQSVTETTSDESEAHEEAEPASNAQIREMDSIVSAMEADVTAGCDFFTRANEANPSPITRTAEKKEDKNETNAPSTAEAENKPEVTTDTAQPTACAGDATTNEHAEERARKRILIKLKYLNDTLKEVEGSLDELLKDFKWRHFSTELTAECRVRLIFNGHVLLDDSATLQACGLHNRAVVHCLVHPKRTGSNQQRGGMPEEGPVNATHELITERAQPERAWDLENILMTLVSVALTVVWFFRCEYSNLFTASASLALFGLTVFYSVAIFGLYLSDTFQFDRRPTQPVPEN